MITTWIDQLQSHNYLKSVKSHRILLNYTWNWTVKTTYWIKELLLKKYNRVITTRELQSKWNWYDTCWQLQVLWWLDGYCSHNLFNTIFTAERIPNHWNHVIVNQLYKPNDDRLKKLESPSLWLLNWLDASLWLYNRQQLSRLFPWLAGRMLHLLASMYETLLWHFDAVMGRLGG